MSANYWGVFHGLYIGGAATDPRIEAGAGSPEGVLSRPVGSIYLRKDGSASTTLYVKESGTGNTGWVPAGSGAATLSWQGAWDSGTAYAADDLVEHDGSAWISTSTTIAGDEPGVSPKWDLVAQKGDTGATGAAGATGDTGPAGPQGDPGLVGDWQGAWSNVSTYAALDAVEHNGSSWIANAATSAGEEPGVSAKWDLVAAKGNTGAAGDLTDLDDVTITTPVDGHVLTYDSGQWVNAPASGGGDSTTADTYANRPTAGNSGNLFFPNNSLYVERDNGSAWESWGPIWKLTPPVDGDFAWVNQGTATVSVANGGVFLEAPIEAGISLHIRKKPAPSTPYSITAYLLPCLLDGGGNAEVGLLFRQSSDGKISAYGIRGIALDTLVFFKFGSPTIFDASYGTRSRADTLLTPGRGMWFRIADDGTNRSFGISFDGLRFWTLHTVGRTDYLTADEIGFYAHANGGVSNAPFGVWLLSWKQGS